MALRMFTPNTSWEAARRDARFTVSRLAAQEVHASLARPLADLLEGWLSVDRERIGADDGLVRAQALIAAVDASLDEAVADFADWLRYRFGASHPIYKTFFPQPPGQVTRLHLEPELQRTARFAVVAREVDSSKEMTEHLRAIAAIEERGKKALAARTKAQQEVSRVGLRIAGWKDDANQARRQIAHQLDAHATDHHLPRSYSGGFFPAASATRKPVVAAKPSPAPPE